MIRFLIGNIIMVLILIGDDIYRRADTPHTCPERSACPRRGEAQSKGPTPQTGGLSACLTRNHSSEMLNQYVTSPCFHLACT